ncbi:MAG: hypothetical protein K8R77_04800, partial [Anaerolineaceae bacterium]|nr:hypothetical protein [Anaerolineaceae bacterium]
MNLPLEWLLEGPAWMQYRIRLDICRQPEDDPQVIAARQALLSDAKVQKIITELQTWPGLVLNSHKSAKQPFHKLNFLADIGLRAGDPGMDAIIGQLMSHQSEQGPFQLIANVSPRYGGSGQDTWAWALCDAPLLVYALFRFGLGKDPKVQAALNHLLTLLRENGWPCAVSPEMGRFRGPGRKDDPCPYANLAMLKVLGLNESLRASAAANTGVETLLHLWENRQEKHPYIFYMGTDFCKLKAPLIWYDILHVLDVLTMFPAWHQDPRLQDMLGILQKKANPEGQFTAESMWRAWKNWEFGQKKIPSRWI